MLVDRSEKGWEWIAVDGESRQIQDVQINRQEIADFRQGRVISSQLARKGCQCNRLAASGLADDRNAAPILESLTDGNLGCALAGGHFGPIRHIGDDLGCDGFRRKLHVLVHRGRGRKEHRRDQYFIQGEHRGRQVPLLGPANRIFSQKLSRPFQVALANILDEQRHPGPYRGK